MAAQWKRISAKRREFCSVINCERLNLCSVSYFVNNNPTSTLALIHMLHQRACVCVCAHRLKQGRVCREKKKRAGSCREKRLPTQLSKARHSPERAEALNYKSSSFKQPCRLAGSLVCWVCLVSSKINCLFSLWTDPIRASV